MIRNVAGLLAVGWLSRVAHAGPAGPFSSSVIQGRQLRIRSRMHLGVLAEYWWVVLSAMALVLAGFVFVAGRGAEGGLGGRARLGWGKWRALSRRVGEGQARVLLTVFYFTLAAPFGLARTLLADPLRLRRGSQQRSWLARATRDRTLDDARRQY